MNGLQKSHSAFQRLREEELERSQGGGTEQRVLLVKYNTIQYNTMGNPKTLTPGPRTPTTDRVRGLPTDRSTDYPYGPLYGPPAK